MNALVAGFAEELAKTANLTEVVEHMMGRPGSPMRKAMARAAALGAGTTAVQTALQPHAAGEERHYLRNALAGAAAGAVTGRAFPGWFGRSQMIPELWSHFLFAFRDELVKVSSQEGENLGDVVGAEALGPISSAVKG
jgi:hypothetical protein